ncbi:unnamed protein product [Soboliphyme baturini]|uniref:Rap-GAP domain-containing protein n=1 Tax=Soboliphyme baturini TaxID=241478 RepID=A0A183J3W6_9BILA|nr:unnamed protein product [Soboliphyme baturini]
MRKAGLMVPTLYRIIIRLSDVCSSWPGSSIYSGGKIPVKELLDLIIPELQQNCLRLALPVPRTEEMLLRLDEQSIYIRYKVGILYCKAGQCTEEQLYNNEYSGPAFEEFLDILGQRVRLKGFDKYKGGLDNKGDSTGMYSLYTMYQQYEIMFHVSTMLPFTASNRQQLSRKRHIGNDIVTIIFQDPGALPFNPRTMRSHFQHVFIIVRVSNPSTDNVRYRCGFANNQSLFYFNLLAYTKTYFRVAVSRCKGVAAFGPPIAHNTYFPKSREFREFLLTKIINAENAVHKSAKFEEMAARTRRELMRELSEHHVTSQSLEGTSVKIANKILGPKRKDRPKPKVFLDSCIRGAVTWDVQVLTEVEDFSLCRPIECYLGISMDYLVLIEHSSKNVLFCTPTHSVIGWTSHGNSVKLYYDHADVIILRTLDDDDGLVMNEIIRRLQFVSKGCETVGMILRRNPGEPLCVRIQHEGIVSEVDMYSCAWQAGLRQGSRIVEICKVSVSSLNYEKILELLNISSTIRLLVIPSLEDGSPRRGCEDPYCSAILGDQTSYVTNWNDQPLALPQHPPGRIPPSYDKILTSRSADSENVFPPGQKSSFDLRDHGYESASNSFSIKSFEDVQTR